MIMYTFEAMPLRAAPARNAAPPASIDGLCPKALVTQEAANNASDVEGGREGGQQVAVEFAVVADLRVFLHLGVDPREELLQKWFHGYHSSCAHIYFVGTLGC